MHRYGTLAIDRAVVRRTGKRRPRALFLPTAASDDPGYYRHFQRVYGKRLGCRTDVLYLCAAPPPRRAVARTIARADLIYVGGGNTLKMMRRWRHLGVDRLLRRAWREGTVCSGLSAGALCWFAWGHSDSLAFYHPEAWDYIRVRGLGLYPFTLCPHYDGEKREADFHRMLRKRGGIGIALDNGAALEIVDDRYRVLTSKRRARAYRVTRRRGRILQEPIPESARPVPLRWLLD